MDKKIEKAIYPLTQMYENIENDLLKKIASHFLYNEEFLNSDYWRIKKLDEMGLFNEEIINYIARYSNKTKEEVLKALNKIGIQTIDLNNLNRLFEDEVLKVNPNILADNYVIKNMISSAYNEISNHFIEMSSKIENATREAYLNVIEECYLKTSMGTHSYQEAIRESIDKLGNSGITTLTYTTTDEEGNVVGIRKYDVSSTARREILTGARQLSSNINLEKANVLNCEYLYLSEHLECRPDHFDWQGTIIKKEDLIPITDYGSVTGLCGINCKHYAEPYFGDKRGNDLKQFNKEETAKAYELSQKQRYLERGVRKWKRKAEMFKINEDKEAYIKSNNKVKEWQLKVKDFTEKNNLRRDYTREYINKRYPDWYINLTIEEKRDLNEYISSGSYKINEPLYSKRQLTQEQIEFIDNLDHALLKIPKYKGLVYRSVSIESQNQLNEILSIFNNKDRIGSWASYISSSKMIYDSKMNLQFKIKSINGRNISSLNKEGGGEILFERNTKFKYIDYKIKSGTIYVNLEEVE